MGQRLNIEIVKNNVDDLPLANAYYHWSGFTRVAFSLASIIMDSLKDTPDYCKEDNNLIPLAVFILLYLLPSFLIYINSFSLEINFISPLTISDIF